MIKPKSKKIIITTEVRVSPLIRDFVNTIYQSNIIELKKNDYLTLILRPLLCLVPENYKPFKPTDCFVKIQLCHQWRYGFDIRYRNYLDELGQKFLNDFLYSQFKEIFFSFVQGCVTSGIEQQKAIELFCKAYNMNSELINFDMLIKSWNRSNNKKRWKSTHQVSINKNY